VLYLRKRWRGGGPRVWFSGLSPQFCIEDPNHPGAGNYWARPVRLQGREQVDLVIERYVGRSIARMHGD